MPNPHQEDDDEVLSLQIYTPAPGFPRHDDDRQKTWMGQHGTYLDRLLGEGKIVAHGPVMDPAGGYGVSLYQIEDDENIEALTSLDPIVQNGAGHYEHYPMLHIKHRG